MFKRLFLKDQFILILILLNAVLLFWGGFDIANSTRTILRSIDSIITVLFIIEVIVKVRNYGLKGYFSSRWNLFDFVLILLSVPELFAFTLNIETIDVSYLIAFRIFRVFKSFRFFKFIPNVKHIIKDIQLAIKASVFVFLAFVVFLFILGILSNYIFANNPTEYFSDPLKSLYTIFKIFTVEGWFEIPEQLTETYTQTQSFFTYLYFVIIVLVGGIFGLSMVTSIFVDSMVSDNNDQLEEKVDRLDEKMDRVLKQLEN